MQPAHTSIYSMLLTLLFYTTASVCALRAAAWLSVHALLPALSRVISHCYHHYRQRSTPEATRHAGISSSSSSPPLAGSGSGTLFKLVRTAAGHALFVPVSIAGPGAHDAQVADGLSGASDWTAPSMIPCPLLLRNAMLGFWLTSFLGTTILILLTYRYPNSYTYIQAVSTKTKSGDTDAVFLAPLPVLVLFKRFVFI